MTSSDATLGALLRSLIDALDGDVERVYTQAGLDFRPRFTPVVKTLASEGPLRIKDLSARVGLSHSALSQTVGQLVSRGWIDLRPGADGRERVASLTPQAMAALPRLRTIWAATARAAQTLNDELGIDLEEVARQALDALQNRSFHERIATAGSGPGSR